MMDWKLLCSQHKETCDRLVHASPFALNTETISNFSSGPPVNYLSFARADVLASTKSRVISLYFSSLD